MGAYWVDPSLTFGVENGQQKINVLIKKRLQFVWNLEFSNGHVSSEQFVRNDARVHFEIR
jgi:hypothetical protein